MGSTTLGELQIDAVIPVNTILEFRMEVRRDSHAVMHLEGLVTEAVGTGALFQSLEHSGVMVRTEKATLFAGNISNIQIMKEGACFHISLEGISATEQLDNEKKRRTFQDVSRTYGEVMHEVLKDTTGSWAKICVDDRKMEQPVYQIEETDWEFIRRLSSYLGAPITPSIASGKPGLFVGLTEGKMQNLSEDTVMEKVWIDRKNKSTCCVIRCQENWDIGDLLELEGKVYSVTEKTCCSEGGILCFRYILSDKKYFIAERYENLNASGCLLRASVLESKNEQVKVKFDIDKEQPVNEAYWYPWRPDTGNIVYCMPVKGETVYIHLGDASGKQVRAICGVHNNGSGNPEMQANQRYFTTTDNKRMSMLVDSLSFESLNQLKPLEMELQDKSGINMRSVRNIVISAKDAIGIKGNHVLLQAPKEVSLVRKNIVNPAVINMCNGFDSVGATNTVKSFETGNSSFVVFEPPMQEKNQEYSLDGVEKDVLMSTPGVRLGKGLEEQVGGICVSRL